MKPFGTQTYSVHEVAALLGVSRNKVYASVRRNEIPHRRLGRRIIFPIAMVNNWLHGKDPEPCRTNLQSGD